MADPIEYERRIVEVLPSLYFSPVAEVLVTSCGHRHVRPVATYHRGNFLRCPFCTDEYWQAFIAHSPSEA